MDNKELLPWDPHFAGEGWHGGEHTQVRVQWLSLFRRVSIDGDVRDPHPFSEEAFAALSKFIQSSP
jgi:hypothetical protein